MTETDDIGREQQWWVGSDDADENDPEAVHTQRADPADPAPPQASRPSTRAASVALALALTAAVVGVVLVWFGSSVLDRRPYGSPAGYERVSYARGVETVRFTRSGTYLGYVETPTAADPRAGSLFIQPVDGTAAIGQVHEYTRHVDYTLHGRHGYARWTLRVEHPGRFAVTVRNRGLPTGSQFAIGHVDAIGLVAGLLLVVPGAFLVTTAVGLLVLGLVLRRRTRRG